MAKERKYAVGADFIAELFDIPRHRVYRAVENGRVRRVVVPGKRILVDIRDLRRNNFSGPPVKGKGRKNGG